MLSRWLRKLTKTTQPIRKPGRSLRNKSRIRLHLEALEDRTVPANGMGPLQAAASFLPARVEAFTPGGFLTGPQAGQPLDIALTYLTAHAADLGLLPGDVANPEITDHYVSSNTGVTHIYLRQQFNGLDVENANMNINVTADGCIINIGGGFVRGLSSRSSPVAPTLGGVQAVQAAAARLDLTLQGAPTVISIEGGIDRRMTLNAAGASVDPIPAKLQYVATAAGVKLAWGLIMQTPDGQHWYDVSVDASSGSLLAKHDWVDPAEYEVFKLPIDAPNDGSRTIEVNPQDATASPFGWHDTNGVPGAEFTDTRGNNVSAQEDANGDNSGGSRPSGGASLIFDFPLNLAQQPSTYQNAATTNLFYMNNILHDIHYQYGFDEVSGNFQVTNYSGNGLGGDPVQADAQDGGGINNANMATPPDGISPRMQMFLWNLTSPMRDGDLDNGIITHEFGHGVSNRLTGGPGNSNALDAIQSGGMGEGWSDWWALMFTQRATDLQNNGYGIGTYVLGQPSTGVGIRRQPYSFNLAIDPITLGAFNSSSQVHNTGEIWCSALWDMNWLLINKYGYSADLYNGTAGNNVALQLVTDALKLQPANPSFLEARDAILMADEVLSGGANHNEIWTAFARRGMGFSADDGPNANSTTVVEAFDLPPIDPRVNQHTPSGGIVTALSSFVFKFSEQMNTGSFNVAADVASFTGPSGSLLGQISGFTWIDNRNLQVNFTSQTAQGQYAMVIGPQILAFDNGNPMDQDFDSVLGEPDDDQYTATVAIFQKIFEADFSGPGGAADLDGFTVDNGATGLWHLSIGHGGETGHSADDSMYYGTGENASGGGHYNTGTNAGSITSPSIDLTTATAAELAFNYILQTEDFASGGFDLATVQISANGGAFSTIASNATTISDPTTGWTAVSLDLSAYLGSSIRVRFDFDTVDNLFNAFEGWYVDDVVVKGNIPSGTNPDIVLQSVTSDGLTTLTVTYNIANGPVSPFQIGMYRSTDTTFGGDTLTGSVLIDAPGDLASGPHTKVFTIGGGAGQISLPGVVAPEVDSDYFLLAVADHLNAVIEDDADAYNEDNTLVYAGSYHAAGGNVFVQTGAGADDVDVTVGGGNLTVTVNSVPKIYSLGDVSGVRVRTHGGIDNVDGTTNSTPLRAWGGSEDDVLTGGSAGDTLEGGSGNDVLEGGGGGDTVVGGAGNDSYVFKAATSVEADIITELFGEGIDLLDFSALTVPVAANLTLNTPSNLATHANRTLKTSAAGQAANFENVTGGSANDNLTGNASANVLTGNSGNDTFTGGAGNDSLIGGLGNDIYTFKAATSLETDTIFESPGGGIDTLNFTTLNASTPVTANLGSATTTVASHSNRVVLVSANGGGADLENVAGGQGGDSLTGNAAANQLVGGAGNDTLAGGGGNDILEGGFGNDNISGGLGNDSYIFKAATPAAETDTVNENPAEGIDLLSFATLNASTPVTVNLLNATTIATHTNRTVLSTTGVNFDNVTGGAAGDNIAGNDSNNVLMGGNGNDTLDGKGGTDTLNGGPGTDTGLNGEVLISIEIT